MQTVSQPVSRPVIEVSARFKSLNCDQIAARFRSIQSPVQDSKLLWKDLAKEQVEYVKWIMSTPNALAMDEEQYRKLLKEVWAGVVAVLLFGPNRHADDIAGGDPVTFVERALEVRCSMRDCPGRAGWVVHYLLGAPDQPHLGPDPPPAFNPFSQRDALFYVSPRGYVEVEPDVFAPSRRQAEQRRRGYASLHGFVDPDGRGRNKRPFDELAAPLKGSEMPTETRELWAGDNMLTRCSSCQAPRFLRVTAEDAAAHLANERCGMLRSA